jgi:hypothetical protein
MTNSEKERGEKRGVLTSDRAAKVGKSAGADAANDDGDEE